jgi:hypothetical protein
LIGALLVVFLKFKLIVVVGVLLYGVNVDDVNVEDKIYRMTNKLQIRNLEKWNENFTI